MVTKQSLDVRGTKVEVTNLNKIFCPKAGFSKKDVIDYYVRISSVLLWDEVESLVQNRNAQHLTFAAKEVLKRVEKMGDLFDPVLTLKQKLPSLSVIQNLGK